MTDEEKAEEYAEDYKTKDGRSLDYCDISKAYLAGLEEGRKEEQLENSKEKDLYCMELEQEYAKLEKENAELSNSVTELTNTKTELENKVTELEKQIKKMRNCGNCNGIINGIRQEKCHFCMRSKLLSEWELAE